MRKGIKIAFAAATIVGLLFSSGCTLNPGMIVVPSIEEAKDPITEITYVGTTEDGENIYEKTVTEENIAKGTIIHVYGYYGTGYLSNELENLKELGLSHWIGQSGVRDDKSDQNYATVYIGRNPISERDMKKYDLVELNGLEVPMFWESERLEDGSSITYVTTNPIGNDITPISNPDTKIYEIISTTGEKRLASVTEVNEVNSGNMPGWSLVGVYDRERALVDGKEINRAVWEEEKKNKSCELSDGYVQEIIQTRSINEPSAIPGR